MAQMMIGAHGAYSLVIDVDVHMIGMHGLQ